MRKVRLPSGKTIEVELHPPPAAKNVEMAPPLDYYCVQRSEGILYRTVDRNLDQEEVQLEIESGDQQGERIWVGFQVFTAGELELVGPVSKQRLPSED